MRWAAVADSFGVRRSFRFMLRKIIKEGQRSASVVHGCRLECKLAAKIEVLVVRTSLHELEVLSRALALPIRARPPVTVVIGQGQSTATTNIIASPA